MTTPFNVDSSAVSSLAGSLTLVNGRTFTVARPDGQLVEPGDGTVFEDIRMLSLLQLQIHETAGDGSSEALPQLILEHLGTANPNPFNSISVKRPREAHGAGEPTELFLHRQWIGRGVRHDVEVQNHGMSEVKRTVVLRFGTDFAHLFDMKEGRSSGVAADFQIDDSGAWMRHPDPTRDLAVSFQSDPLPKRITASDTNGTIEMQWDLRVDPKASTMVSVLFEPVWDSQPAGALFSLDRDPRTLTIGHHYHQAREANIKTTDGRLARAFDQALEDLASLRIFDPANPSNTVVAAGAPWFMTLFGRDSLLTSWMALPFAPELSVGVLQALAELQGTESVAESEEEPGKIIHELRRHGGSDAFSERGRYYGTIDATPLFVMLAAETRRWGHLDDDALKRLWPSIAAALSWTRRALAKGPGGFLSYRRSTEVGLVNQGWKDSWDGVTYADGSLASGFIGLVEVQGYAYACLLGAAELAEHVEDPRVDPDQLRTEAAQLKERFNKVFWMESASAFAIGVDENGSAIDSVTTNPGHALWSGIADIDLGSRYLDRIMDDDLWSGWGLRTLSPTAAAFNPLSYHNGSVWPHDTSLVAAGAARIGRMDAVETMFDGAMAAADAFDGRPPELFAGLSRSSVGSPISYPSSCSPQAWASGSVLLHLRNVLGLMPPESVGGLPVLRGREDDGLSVLGDIDVTAVRSGEVVHLVRLGPGTESVVVSMNLDT